MNDIASHQNVRMAFDWTSKAMVALYAAVATATLMASGYYVIRGIRKRSRLTNRPVVKVPAAVATVELEVDATATP